MMVRGVLTILVLLLPLVPPGLAETHCAEVERTEGCVTFEEFAHEECSTRDGATGCSSGEGQMVEVEVRSGYAAARAEVERERRVLTYHLEAGACTTVEFMEEREMVEATHLGGALLAGAAGWAYVHHANGTLVYEDPCGENLLPGVEPGTYEFRVTHVGGLAIMQLPYGTVVVYVRGTDGTMDDENGQADCFRSAEGFLMIMTPLAPPVVLEPATGDTC